MVNLAFWQGGDTLQYLLGTGETTSNAKCMLRERSQSLLHRRRDGRRIDGAHPKDSSAEHVFHGGGLSGNSARVLRWELRRRTIPLLFWWGCVLRCLRPRIAVIEEGIV
jgi:hypothetical protein